ncbi:MAG: hypothetical protein AAF770_01010 [Bacteroidota bacterium]
MNFVKALLIVAGHIILGLLFYFFTKNFTPVPKDFLSIDLQPHIYSYKKKCSLSLLFVSLWVPIFAWSFKRYIYAALAQVLIFGALEFIIFVFNYNQIHIIRELTKRENHIKNLQITIKKLETELGDKKKCNQIGEGIHTLIKTARCLVEAALGKEKK